LDEDVVILSTGGTHDSSLVNVLDVMGLKGVSINGDREMGDASIVLLEAFWAFGFGSSLIASDATLEVTDGSSRSGLDSCGVEVPKGFSLSNGCIELFLPDDIGLGVSCVNSLLDCIGLASEGFDEGGFMADLGGLRVQLGDSGTSDGFGQGMSSLGCESTGGIIEDVEGSLWFDEWLTNHFENRG
jgi:hypothetical protein